MQRSFEEKIAAGAIYAGGVFSPRTYSTGAWVSRLSGGRRTSPLPTCAGEANTHCALPEATGAAPSSRGAPETPHPLLPATSPGATANPPPPPLPRDFPVPKAAGVGRGAARSSRSLPALVNQAEEEKKAGGTGDGTTRLLPAQRRLPKPRRRRGRGARPGAPSPPPGLPAEPRGCPSGPRQSGGRCPPGAAPGLLRPQPELLCASAGEARALRAPTAVTLFALAVNSLRLHTHTPHTHTRAHTPHPSARHRVKSRLTIPS